MTKKRKRLLAILKELGALYVNHSLMTLELVRRTVQSPSNQSSESLCTLGCPVCGLICQIDPYCWGAADNIEYCPGCGEPDLVHLEDPPSVVDGPDGIYLEGKGGFRTGPYSCRGCVREYLWDWFDAKCEEENAKESDQKGSRKGHQKNRKEKSERKRRVKSCKHLNIVGEDPTEREHSRCVGSPHEDGKEMEGKDPDTAS